jgi:outer membrane protein TolC
MGFPFYPAVPQTAAGRVTVNMSASQAVPWLGTLETKARTAEAETNVARAKLAAKELEVIEQVKRAYYELYFIQQAIRITEENRELLLDFVQIADSKYRTGKASQQDVLRAQVEASNLANQLIRLRQELASTQAQLARLLHASPDTPVGALAELPAGEIPANLDRLYEEATRQRPELHAQLAEIQRDRHGVELARLAYFPDFKFSVDWTEMSAAGAMAPTADGIDDVGIGMMVDVPIYRKRLAAGVREAEAQTVASVREYDSLRDGTVQEVKDLFAQSTSQYDLVRLFRDDIIPKSQQTLEVSQAAYQVGDVDFLQLIDNWQQLLRFQIAYYRLESQLQQSLAMLERVVGGQIQTVAPSERGSPAPPTQP